MGVGDPDEVTIKARGGQRSRERTGREAFGWDDEPPLADVLARFAERDEREAMDNRTLAERWLGDPPLWRSAFSKVRRPNGDCSTSNRKIGQLGM